VPVPYVLAGIRCATLLQAAGAGAPCRAHAGVWGSFSTPAVG
jgi:hypothetical protein